MKRILPSLIVSLLLMATIVGTVMVSSHQEAVSTAQVVEQANVTRDSLAWKAFQKRVSQQRRLVAKQTAREQVAAERAAKRQAVRRAELLEEARRREAARQAARQRAAAEAAARRAAAREAVERKAEARKAAARARAAARAARVREAARKEVRQEAIAQAAAADVIVGSVTDSDVVGAVIGRVGDYPGQRWSRLNARQQSRVRAMVSTIDEGGAYSCPAGSGRRNRDIVMGAQVRVRDGRGSVIAASTLTGGRLTQRGCTFTFSARVSKAQVYRVRVAQRGAVEFSNEGLTAQNWRVALKIT